MSPACAFALERAEELGRSYLREWDGGRRKGRRGHSPRGRRQARVNLDAAGDAKPRQFSAVLGDPVGFLVGSFVRASHGDTSLLSIAGAAV